VLSKRYSKERSHDQKYLDIVSETMLLLIKFFAHELKSGRANYSMCQAMTIMFDPDRMIHRFHFRIPEHELWKKCTQKEKWRNELKEGDMVDVLVKADDRSRLKGWMQGKITATFDDDKDSIRVEFPDSVQFYDTKVSRWSMDVMRFESQTKEDWAWRRETLSNSVDLECEIHDKASWNKGTIIDYKTIEMMDRKVLMAYCALRVYRDIPNCPKKDDRGTYEGWSERFDDWVPVFSPRIIPWGSNPQAQKVQEENDENDDLFEATEESPVVYAVPRLNNCMSSLFVRLINVFGNLDGFKMIMDLLESEKDIGADAG
jgi:hypothetical protein